MSISREWLLALDTYANATYGRSIWRSIVAGTCVSCGRSAHLCTRTDAARRYPRYGLCEHCQNASTSVPDTIVPFNQNYRAE